MSQVSTRKSIRKTNTSSDITGKALAAGFTLAATALFASIKVIQSTSKTVMHDLREVNLSSDTIKKISANKTLKDTFRKKYSTHKQYAKAKGLSESEASKVALLMSAEQTPFLIKKQDSILEHINAIDWNGSPDKIKKALSTMMKAIDTEHTDIFFNQVAHAVKDASIETGFDRIRIYEKDGNKRIVAENGKSQLLVNEIKKTDRGEVDIITETINIHDISCCDVMDKFDNALSKKGIDSEKPDRKNTGGISVSSNSHCNTLAEEYKKQKDNSLANQNRNKKNLPSNLSSQRIGRH